MRYRVGPRGAVAVALTRTGLANGAKMKRLLSVGGPRNGWALSLLQREVLAVDLVTDLTGISCHMRVAEETEDMVRGADLFSTMVAAEVAVYLQPILLLDADCFSVASSVELRVAFMDSRVFSASVSRGQGRQLGNGLVPKSNRLKVGTV
jgi:hypothetical protein